LTQIGVGLEQYVGVALGQPQVPGVPSVVELHFCGNVQSPQEIFTPQPFEVLLQLLAPQASACVHGMQLHVPGVPTHLLLVHPLSVEQVFVAV